MVSINLRGCLNLCSLLTRLCRTSCDTHDHTWIYLYTRSTHDFNVIHKLGNMIYVVCDRGGKGEKENKGQMKMQEKTVGLSGLSTCQLVCFHQFKVLLQDT